MPVQPNVILDQTDLAIGQIQTTVEFEVVAHDLSPLGSLRPLTAESVAATASGQIKRTLNGVRLTQADLNDLNPFTDMLRPWMVLGDGSRWPLGVFCFTSLPRRINTHTDILDATMLDQGFKLDQESSREYSIPPGGWVLDMVNTILDVSAVPFENRVLPSGANVRVVDPVGWTASTKKSQILEQCARMLNCLPPYFDNRGRFVLRAYPDFDNTDADVSYRTDGSRMIAGSIVRNDNLLTAPNVYRVVGSGPTNADVHGEARVNPDLPYSVEKRGFEIVKTVQMQGVGSSSQAEGIARSLAAAAPGFEEFEFESLPDPRHDLFMLVDVDGVRYRELGFEISLPGGPMRHRLTTGGFPVAG